MNHSLPTIDHLVPLSFFLLDRQLSAMCRRNACQSYPAGLTKHLSLRLFRSNVLLEKRCALSWHYGPSHLIGLKTTDTLGLSTTWSVCESRVAMCSRNTRVPVEIPNELADNRTIPYYALRLMIYTSTRAQNGEACFLYPFVKKEWKV